MKQSGTAAGACLAVAVAVMSLSSCSSAPAGAPAAAPAAAPVNSSSTGADRGADTVEVAAKDASNGAAKKAAKAEASRCSVVDNWNTAPDDGGLALSPAHLTEVRVGRHGCYDRVVFDVNGPSPVGFLAKYVPVVTADGSGDDVPVAGSAALEVVVRAPFVGSDDPSAWQDMPRPGDDLVAESQLIGWGALRGITFAGSFEGQTTIAVGVQETRAFRMWTLESADGQRLILDIAH